jgi:hypothetical protein
MVVFGLRTFGDCSEVPDHFHVATRFFHVWFIPLIPVGSFLVLEEDDDDDTFRGMSVGLDIRSTLMAWFRTFWVLLALGALGMGIMWLINGPPRLVDAQTLADVLPAAVAGIAYKVVYYGAYAAAALGFLMGVGVYFLSHVFNEASEARARALCEKTGYPLELVDMYFAGRDAPGEAVE